MAISITQSKSSEIIFKWKWLTRGISDLTKLWSIFMEQWDHITNIGNKHTAMSEHRQITQRGRKHAPANDCLRTKMLIYWKQNIFLWRLTVVQGIRYFIGQCDQVDITCQGIFYIIPGRDKPLRIKCNSCKCKLSMTGKGLSGIGYIQSQMNFEYVGAMFTGPRRWTGASTGKGIHRN